MDNTRALSRSSAGEYQGGLLYPTMLVAAIAVIIFSVIGIAAITGLLPMAASTSFSQPVVSSSRDAVKAETTMRAAQVRAVARPAGAAGSCADCGGVSSARALEAEAATSGLRAAAGGVAGFSAIRSDAAAAPR